MNPNEIRIAVAEELGFEHWEAAPGVVYLRRPQKEIRDYWIKCGDRVTDKPITQAISPEVPNYTSDLNACHEMEKALSDEEWPQYIHHFRTVDGSLYRQFAHKSADEKCEAFLRVRGKWKETPKP